jgi:transposase InsO family protein
LSQRLRSNCNAIADYSFKRTSRLQKCNFASGASKRAERRATPGLAPQRCVALYSFKVADYSFFDTSKQAGLIFHSDRGSQYASKDYRDVLTEYSITASMSRRGDCWDNACSETLFGSLKVERLHGQRFKTRRQAMDEVIAWMLWYNRARLHSTLAYVSPMRFEENWLASQPRQASA